MDDFLAELDAAIDQLCACGCHRPITDQSPSAYYAMETCAGRWHRKQRISVGDWGLEDVVAVQVTARRVNTEPPATGLRRVLEEVRAAVVEVARHLGEALRRAAGQLVRIAERVSPPRKPPLAPWQQVGRAARRIDPVRGFSGFVRGGEAYRPPRKVSR